MPRLICWRRDLREALRGRLVDGGGGWRFPLRRGRGGFFALAPVVAVVSAALWCRDWRLALPAAALLALFLAALAAG